MEVTSIIADIDAQIAKLTEARRVLETLSTTSTAEVVKKSGRGRPKGSKNATTPKLEAAEAPPRKRKLSPEGRKRIADAMKRRWAERKSTAS